MEDSPATWDCFGGSRGGSKSGAVRRVNMIRRKNYPGSKSLIIRRTFDDVWENHISKYFEEWPVMRDWYSATHKEITFPNGSITKFGYAEHKNDIHAFQGKEYMDIFVDEATHFEEDELRFLKTCNRATGLDDSRCKMVLTTNPGNIGHKFIKRLFFDGIQARKTNTTHLFYHENEVAEDYEFIQAYAWDNIEWVRPYLQKNGVSDTDYYKGWTDKQRFECFIRHSTYGRELNALPQMMRIGHLLGRWDIFAGQYFDIFNAARHVFNVDQMGLKDWHRRHISIDWGFAHRLACYWHSTEGKVKKTYREYIANGPDAPKTTGPREAAQEIVRRSRLQNGTKERISVIYLSPDAFAQRTAESPVSEQMGDVFRAAGLPSPTKANDDRCGGWMKMREGLQYDEWIMSDDCKELISVLPAMAHDEDKPNDCVKFDGDDAADGARYGVYEGERTTSAPHNERIAAAVAEMQKVCPPVDVAALTAMRDAGIQGPPPVDYNIVAMQSRIAEAKERKKFQPVRRGMRHRWGPPRQAVESYR